MSLRRLLYHSAVYGLTTALSRLLNWLLTPLYAHRLPIEDFGRLSELYSWIVFGLIATGLGMETAYFRFGDKKDLGAAFWKMLGVIAVVGLGLNGTLSVGVPFFSEKLGYAGREGLLWLTISLWTVDAAGSFALAHQRAVGAPLRFAVIQLTHVGLFLTMNIWGVGVQGYGIEFILSANLIASCLRLGWALLWGPPWRVQREGASSTPSLGILFSYGATLAGMGLLGATNDVLDRILLARYDLQATALYSAAYKIAMALALFVQAYRQAGEPLLLGEHRGDQHFYERSWLFYHGVALGGVLLLTIWAPPLLTTRWGGLLPAPIFPPAYHEAFTLVPLLLWANLFMGSLVQASIWYKLRKHPTAGMVITAAGSLITWTGNLYGIPRYGYWACAWTTLMAYAFMVSLSVMWGRRELPSAFPLRPLLLPGATIASITAALGVYPLSPDKLWERLFLTALGFSVLGITFWRRFRKA